MGSVLPTGLEAVTRDVRRLYVVGFDPGQATGWAVLRMDLDKLCGDGFTALALGGTDPDRFAWRAGEFRGSENHIVDMMMALVRGVWMEGDFGAGPDSDVVVLAVEDFILQMLSMERSLLSPVRITAAFGYAGRTLPMPRLFHSASDAKKVVTDERLRRWNLWSVGPDHPRDATRHAVVVARKFVEPAWRERMLAACGWLAEGES